MTELESHLDALTNLDTFERGQQIEHFVSILESDRRPQRQVLDGLDVWSVFAHDQTMLVCRDPATFSSNSLGTMLKDSPREQLDSQLNTLDPPQHTRLRRILSRMFVPAAIRSLDETIRGRVDNLLDHVPAGQVIDVVPYVSAELPLIVIADLLGVPIEDRNDIFNWSNAIAGLDDSEYGSGIEGQRAAIGAMTEYGARWAAQRRAEPGDDLITALVSPDVDGGELTPLEFALFFLLLAVAGNETTRNAISWAMVAFGDHPDQWERYRTDPEIRESAVEEVLRWSSPVSHFCRGVTAPTALGDRELAAGDRVVVWFHAANLDPAVFGRPKSFDINRSGGRHVAFNGGGPHLCLGAQLARLEIRAMLDGLAERFVEFEPAGEPQLLRSNFIRGIKHLPMTLRP